MAAPTTVRACTGPGDTEGAACGREVHGRGLCSSHARQRRKGKPLSPIGSTLTRNYATSDEAELIRGEYARMMADGREPKTLRSEKQTCPRGIDPVGALRCQGVSIDGVRVVAGHDAPAEEFGHDGGYCRRRLSRCRAGQCRTCRGRANALRRALRRRRNENLSDRDIRERTPSKRCPRCRTTKGSQDFGIARSMPDGLQTQCRVCQAESSRRTKLPETRRAAGYRRRVQLADSGGSVDVDMDAYAAHWGEDPACIYCDKPGADSVEHLVPVSDGGGNNVANLAPACVSCNSSRQDKPWLRWLEPRLVRVTSTPRPDGGVDVALFRATRADLRAAGLLTPKAHALAVGDDGNVLPSELDAMSESEWLDFQIDMLNDNDKEGT